MIQDQEPQLCLLGEERENQSSAVFVHEPLTEVAEQELLKGELFSLDEQLQDPLSFLIFVRELVESEGFDWRVGVR